jgi:hypothetical protein
MITKQDIELLIEKAVAYFKIVSKTPTTKEDIFLYLYKFNEEGELVDFIEEYYVELITETAIMMRSRHTLEKDENGEYPEIEYILIPLSIIEEVGFGA